MAQTLEELAEKMEQVVLKRRKYEKEYKRTFRDKINKARRVRYANDDKFRLKERERVRKATKPWSGLNEEQKERKRVWQRIYQRKRYQTDPEFKDKQKSKARKSSGGFLKFGGWKSNKAGVNARVVQKQGGNVSRLAGTDKWDCEVCGDRAGLVKHLGKKLGEKVFLCRKCHGKYPHMNHESFKRIKKGWKPFRVRK